MRKPKMYICVRCGTQFESFPAGGVHGETCAGDVVDNAEFNYWLILTSAPQALTRLRIELVPLETAAKQAMEEIKRLEDKASQVLSGRASDRLELLLQEARMQASHANLLAASKRRQIDGLAEQLAIARSKMGMQSAPENESVRPGASVRSRSSRPQRRAVRGAEQTRIGNSGGGASAPRATGNFRELTVPVGVTVHKEIDVRDYSAALVLLPMTSEEVELRVRCSKCKTDGLVVENPAAPSLQAHEIPALGIPCKNSGAELEPEDIACIRHRLWKPGEGDVGPGNGDGPSGPMPSIDGRTGQVILEDEATQIQSDGPLGRWS